MFLLKNAAKLRFLLGVIKFLQKNMSTLGAFVGLLFGRSRGGETICFFLYVGHGPVATSFVETVKQLAICVCQLLDLIFQLGD